MSPRRAKTAPAPRTNEAPARPSAPRPGALRQGGRFFRKFLALPFPLFRWHKVNLANQLTLLRIALLPLYAYLFLSDSIAAQWAGLGVFMVCAFTDWLDGYVARKFNLVTNFGKVMDPLADKLLMLTAMILFVQVGLVPGWMIVVIWWRELAVTGLRTLVAARRTVLAADAWGKAKTFSQVVAIVGGMLVYFLQNTLNATLPDWRLHLENVGPGGELCARILDTNAVPLWTMLIATALSLWSGINYFWKNWSLICLELEEAEKVDA
ncbi:MAG TPA: CDP-diacylglycerol--glycerol-3-phosphate 3-phosphatidyltransferase [bacterium]|jgi:CDP-diacylglycerol--glycerol-3-phosphate 3-phosphatidyltransferase|nr:CDP-diacylglycerol--glycerol-3-phosphate 3-phosphatidyltransferase [bacterium]